MTNILINLYRQAEDYFFRAISIKCLDINDQATAYMTGVQSGELNPLTIRKNNQFIEDALNQSRTFYEIENLPFAIFIPHDFCQQDVCTTLKDMGYLQIGKCVAMVLELGAGQKAYDDAEDRILEADKDLKDWAIPLKDAFEATFEISSQYANAHKRALKKEFNIRHFSLYVEGKPISSVTLSIHKNIARIDDLGTVPELQGRGYATRLMNYTLGQAIKLGATHCFLEASVEGLSLYRNLGFKPLFKSIIYEHRAQKDEHFNFS